MDGKLAGYGLLFAILALFAVQALPLVIASPTVSINATAIVVGPLSVQLYSNTTLISVGQSVKLSNTTTGNGNYIYNLTLNDTAGVVQHGNVLTFNSAGNYLVTLKVTDNNSDIAYSSVVIQVTPALEVTLSANKHTVVQKTVVTLSNTTTGGTGDDSYYYTWSPSTGINWNGNKLSFTGTGQYNITLHVSDLSGETNQSSVAITSHEPLVINESTTTTPLVSKDQFVNVSSTGPFTDSGVQPFTYIWLVKQPHRGAYLDATMCAAPTSLICDFQTNSLTAAGQYSFILQITDNESPRVTIDAPQVTVTVTNALQITSFYASANTIGVGKGVTLINSTTGGTGDNQYTYTLLSGPSGGMVNTRSNEYNFTRPGNYLINLYATDLTGENATANTLVTVLNATNTIPTAPPATISIVPEFSVLDSGEQEVYTATVNGGVGPFEIELFNATSGSQVGSNEMIQGPGGSNTFAFPVTANAQSLIAFNAVATDQGAGQVFNSTDNSILVNPALVVESLIVVYPVLDIGQNETLIGSVQGGTPPYNYDYLVYNNSNTLVVNVIYSDVNSTTNSLTFQITPSMGTGIYNVALVVTDSASDPTEIAGPMSFTVNGASQSSPPANNGGGGGGGGGSGGPTGPTVTLTNSCYLISNFAQLDSENEVLDGWHFNIVENYISPGNAGVTVNGSTYSLKLNQTVSLGESNGYGFSAQLLNISYLPIQHTIAVAICGVNTTAPAQNNTVSNQQNTQDNINLPANSLSTPANSTSNSIGAGNGAKNSSSNGYSNTTGKGNKESENQLPFGAILPILFGILAAIIAGYLVLGTRRKKEQQ